MLTDDTPKTLQEAILYYADRDRCQDLLVAARWPDGVACPHCGSLGVTYLANQRRWKCREKHPRRQFSVKIGTIFEDSPVGLDKWFTAIWLIAGAKNGISSYELHRAIGVTQKTSWFMLHRIRLAMQTGTFGKMSGEVEVDETFVGGKARFMHKNRKDKALAIGKTAVMGLLERHTPEKGHSTVKTVVVPSRKKHRLMTEVDDTVLEGATVYTDEVDVLRGLGSAVCPRVHQPRRDLRARVRPHKRPGEFHGAWSSGRSVARTSASSPFDLHRSLDVRSLPLQQPETERRAAVRERARDGRRPAPCRTGSLTGRPGRFVGATQLPGPGKARLRRTTDQAKISFSR